jgi:hypothetical protein
LTSKIEFGNPIELMLAQTIAARLYVLATRQASGFLKKDKCLFIKDEVQFAGRAWVGPAILTIEIRILTIPITNF